MFKKIQEEVDQIKQQDPSLFEIIFRQKLHSASRFENVEYNIPSILEYVGGDYKNANRPFADKLTQYHIKNLQPFVDNIDSDVVFGVMSNLE